MKPTLEQWIQTYLRHIHDNIRDSVQDDLHEEIDDPELEAKVIEGLEMRIRTLFTGDILQR